MEDATLQGVQLQDANLEGADFEGSDMFGIHFNERTRLCGTNLNGVKGLTEEQKRYAREQGATNVPA